MKLTFFDAARKNTARLGLDYEFWYVINDETDVHSVYVVIGQSVNVAKAWYMTEEELSAYANLVFASVIKMINRFWKQHKRLPEDGTEYWEGKALDVIGLIAVDWRNYVLELEDDEVKTEED